MSEVGLPESTRLATIKRIWRGSYFWQEHPGWVRLASVFHWLVIGVLCPSLFLFLAYLMLAIGLYGVGKPAMLLVLFTPSSLVTYPLLILLSFLLSLICVVFAVLAPVVWGVVIPSKGKEIERMSVNDFLRPKTSVSDALVHLEAMAQYVEQYCPDKLAVPAPEAKPPAPASSPEAKSPASASSLAPQSAPSKMPPGFVHEMRQIIVVNLNSGLASAALNPRVGEQQAMLSANLDSSASSGQRQQIVLAKQKSRAPIPRASKQ